MNVTSYLQQLIPLSAEASEAIQSVFMPAEYSKGHPLLEQGRIARNLYFIEQGIVRIYYYNDQGKDISYGFYSENNMVTVAESFFRRCGSRYGLELLEDSLIYTLSYTNLDILLKDFPELEQIKSHILLYFLQKATDRIVALQFHTAQQRYDTLINSQPDIIQRVALGHIATYLGMTQETLSRIRAKQ